MHAFLIALQFLTRLPLNVNVDWNDKNIAASLLYYPLVGVLISFVLIFIISVLSNQNSMIVAALVLTIWVLITGGLHLDGLADSADAWVGAHGDKQRALDIMKDPRAGPVAVVVLVLILILKFAALYSLIEEPDTNMGVWLLIFSPVLARCVPLVLFLTTPYVREKGLGSAMARYLSRTNAYAVLVFTAITVVLFYGFIQALFLIFSILGVIAFLRYLMIKQIDGMTGDTIGATIEIIEVVVLFILVLQV